MKCTNKEQEACESEKRGCEGCYYNNGSGINVGSIEKKNNTDKELEDLNDFADLLRPEQRYYTNLIKKVIEDRLKDREKIKELEEENMQKDLEKIGIEEHTEASMKEIIEQYYTANEDCVPKQKIKAKIEKIFDVKIHNYNYLADTDWNYSQEQVDRQIASILKRILDEVLDELL